MPKPREEAIGRLKHILITLEFMMNNSKFVSLPENPRQFLSSAYSDFKVALGRIGARGNRWLASIPQFEVPVLDDVLIKKHYPALLIGGQIEGVGNQITRSSFSVCITFRTSKLPTLEESARTTNAPSCCLSKYCGKRRVVRRFHFDFQPGDRGKPISHLQYGGKFPETSHHSDCHYCLESFLERPRFHYLPMDLVLLLDVMIREFKTPLQQWTQEKCWKGLVLQSQKLWWQNYWDRWIRCLNNLGSHTFHEWVYGEIQ